MARSAKQIAASVCATLAVALAASTSAFAQRGPVPGAVQQIREKAAQAAGPQSSSSDSYRPQLVAESRSKELCERVSNRVHVTFRGGSECIAYYTTTGNPAPGPAVLFFDGDVAPNDLAAATARIPANMKVIQTWADQARVRFVYVGRPGVMGSSGNHGERRRPKEMLAMNAAVDAIKARIGVREVVLAGQSGGSTVAAALLTLGRTDVSCAVLGSGSFSVVDSEFDLNQRLGNRGVTRDHLSGLLFDPTRQLNSIPVNANRRVLVIGDRTDVQTTYDQQLGFVSSLRRLGHKAQAFPVMAIGAQMHGTAHLTLPAAALCAQNRDNSQISAFLQRVAKPVPRAVRTSELTR